MATIYFVRTKVPAVAQLRLSVLRSPVKKFKHIVRIGTTDQLLLKGVRDTIYMTGFRGDHQLYGLRVDYARQLMDALVEIGALNRSDADAYVLERQSQISDREIHDAAWNVEYYARKMGLKLTGVQQQQIKKALEL